MGWCQGGSIVQSQVISLYDAGILTSEILDALMAPFSDTDADTAGFYNDIVAKDGKTVEEIICMIMKPAEYVDAITQLNCDEWLMKQSPELRNFANSKVGYYLFESIWHDRWKIY